MLSASWFNFNYTPWYSFGGLLLSIFLAVGGLISFLFGLAIVSEDF